MRNIKAIFKKQLKDIIKNPAILIQFIIFPLVAFVINIIIVTDIDFDGIPEDIAAMIVANLPSMPNMVTM